MTRAHDKRTGDGAWRRGLAALAQLDIDSLGLDQMDRELMTTMARRFDGGPVGLETLAAGEVAGELAGDDGLVHDDIEDNGTERRHRPALWTVWGKAQAINTGDALFTLSRMALHRLEEEGFEPARILRLMRLYDETCLDLCEGQFMDIWTSEHDDWMSVDYYFDMIGRKTAALIAGSAEAGAVLVGGHTIEDDEPKFGLAVTGLVHPDRIWRNAGAQAGDIGGDDVNVFQDQFPQQ